MNGFNRGGMNMGNIQQLMKQAQKMQEDIAATRAELDATEFSGKASGLVEVVLYGNKTLKKISIQPNAVDLSDLEMLEDLIMAAHSDAIKQIVQTEKEKLPALPAGF